MYYTGTVSPVGDCGELAYVNSYDPYSPGSPVDSTLCSGGDTAGGGGGSGGGIGGVTCWTEWVELEISYDDGVTWQYFGGYPASVCGLTPPS